MDTVDNVIFACDFFRNMAHAGIEEAEYSKEKSGEQKINVTFGGGMVVKLLITSTEIENKWMQQFLKKEFPAEKPVSALPEEEEKA